MESKKDISSERMTSLKPAASTIGSAQQAYLTTIVTNKVIRCFSSKATESKNKPHTRQARVIHVGEAITYTGTGIKAHGSLNKHIPKK